MHLSFFILDPSRSSKSYHGAIVHRMMKRGARQYKAIHVRDRHTGRNSSREFTEHTTGRRAVKVERVPFASEVRRDHERLAIHTEPNVREETRVEDFINGLQLVRSPSRQAPKFCAFCKIHSFTRVFSM